MFLLLSFDNFAIESPEGFDWFAILAIHTTFFSTSLLGAYDKGLPYIGKIMLSITFCVINGTSCSDHKIPHRLLLLNLRTVTFLEPRY